jgi:hypothetical protein
MHTSRLPKLLWGKALRHATWLKNRMATRALDGKTPCEALYGQPPDLSTLCWWGCTVWVYSADGSELDVHMCKAHWLGFDVDAKAHRVYWPDMCAVSVECNVYFGSAVQLKGEQITNRRYAASSMLPHLPLQLQCSPHHPTLQPQHQIPLHPCKAAHQKVHQSNCTVPLAPASPCASCATHNQEKALHTPAAQPASPWHTQGRPGGSRGSMDS